MRTAEQYQESLHRATANQSWSNYPTIIAGFLEKGISEADIKPRENVFTFDAWRALGRTVKRGEHGVRIVTYIERTRTVRNPDGTEEERPCRIPKTAVVFHVSQTDTWGKG